MLVGCVIYKLHSFGFFLFIYFFEYKPVCVNNLTEVTFIRYFNLKIDDNIIVIKLVEGIKMHFHFHLFL